MKTAGAEFLWNRKIFMRIGGAVDHIVPRNLLGHNVLMRKEPPERTAPSLRNDKSYLVDEPPLVDPPPLRVVPKFAPDPVVLSSFFNWPGAYSDAPREFVLLSFSIL